MTADFEIDSLCPECDEVITHNPRGRCRCPGCNTRLRVKYDGAEYLLIKERDHDHDES